MFRPCLACGSLFPTLNPRRRFCGPYCRSAHDHRTDFMSDDELELDFRRLMIQLAPERSFDDSS